MNIIEMQAGIQRLKEAVVVLGEVEEILQKSLGTSSVLDTVLALKSKGLPGDELQLLEESKKVLSTLHQRFSGLEIDSSSAWRERLDKDIWKFVHPIASRIDAEKMVNFYLEEWMDEVLDESNVLEDALSGYTSDCTCRPSDCGVGVSLDEIAQMCDLKAYAEYVRTANKKESLNTDDARSWAIHLLTNFCDGVMALDHFDYENYNTEAACQTVVDGLASVSLVDKYLKTK